MGWERSLSCSGQVLFAVIPLPISKGAFASSEGAKAFPTFLIPGDAVTRGSLGLETATATGSSRISAGFLWQKSRGKDNKPRIHFYIWLNGFIWGLTMGLFLHLFLSLVKQFLGLLGCLFQAAPGL